LQAALVSTWALVPAAAYAAAPPAPITVHVDAHGRLTTDTTTASTATLSSLPKSPPSAVARKERPLAAAPSRPSVPVPAGGRAHVVVAGDNLWQIARAEVIRASGSDRPANARIAPYWQQVVEANRSTLRSGDPSLIFPGEVVTLP
jgi:nucleoid-associated protein YgaU